MHPSMSTSNLKEYLEARFLASTVRKSPFPHLVIDDVLPRDWYDHLVLGLPSATEWRAAQSEIKGPPFIRIGEPQSCKALSSYGGWMGQFTELVRQINKLIAEKMRIEIDVHLRQLAADGFIKEAPELVTGQSLFCHRPTGWAIKPHVHNYAEIVQSMIYVPISDSINNLGTTFYTQPRRWIWKRWLMQTVESRSAVEIETLAYKPNRLVSFLNTLNAVHGTNMIPGAPPRQYIFTPIIVHTDYVLTPPRGFTSPKKYQ